ncbi:hypothetical protein KFL_016070020 [Klebsormidium nitens]|uniref:Uncharacterized protein n=1 Tax=Klebsormidium nitens TaxID=105231 RepID=A0A1Y1IVT6_KLENI|nr:hypothetical protein KFL_016070020 [Klebsormidium nitens]|eukprot:GAQ93521.1 hypothetical protein KFL_016070020 [Klebsormidium nitens]
MAPVANYLTRTKLEVTPVTPKSNELPFIERTSDLLNILSKMAMAYKGMKEGNEHAKEGYPGLAYVEGPTGSGKTRLMQELLRFPKTEPPEQLVAEILEREGSLGGEMAREYVDL